MRTNAGKIHFSIDQKTHLIRYIVKNLYMLFYFILNIKVHSTAISKQQNFTFERDYLNVLYIFIIQSCILDSIITCIIDLIINGPEINQVNLIA